MSKSVDWILAMEDKLSSPASGAEKRLAALENRMRALTKAEKDFSDPSDKRRVAARLKSLSFARVEARADLAAEKGRGGGVGSMLAGLMASGVPSAGVLGSALGGAIAGPLGAIVGEKLGSLLGSAVHQAVQLAGRIGQGVYRFAEMGVAAAAAKEETVATFRAMLGSEAAAIRMVDALDEQAAHLKFTGDQTADIARRLLAAGGEFGPENIPTYLRALSDAAAATGASFDKVDAAVDAMRRANAEGKLTSRTLKAFEEVGVPSSKMFEVLAKDLGVTAKQAQALAREGKINVNEGLWAMVGAVAQGRAGGMLGSAGETYVRTTLAGLKKNFEHFKGELFDDLFAGGGLSSFKGFWVNVNAAINPEGATGRRIRGVITGAFNRMFTALFGSFSGRDGADKVEAVISRAVTAVELLVTAGRALWNVFTGFGEGFLASFGLSFDQLFGPAGAADPKKLEAFARAAHSMGVSAGETAGKVSQLVDKILHLTEYVEAFARVSSFAFDLSDGIVDWMARKSGEKDLKEARFRAFLASGGRLTTDQQYAEYLAAGGPALDSEAKYEAIVAARQRISGNEPGLAPSPGGKGDVSNRSLAVNITVNAPGATDPKAVALAARDGAFDALNSFEDLAFANASIDG